MCLPLTIIGAHRHPSGRAGHQANYEDTPQIIDAPGSSTTGSKGKSPSVLLSIKRRSLPLTETVPPTRRHKRKGARQRTGTEDVNSTELRTAEIAAHHAKMREMQEKFIEEDNQRILKALAELDELLDFETVLPLFEAAFLTATDEKGDAENEIITTYKTNEDIIFAIFDIQEQAQKLRRQLMISYRKNLDILLRLAEES